MRTVKAISIGIARFTLGGLSFGISGALVIGSLVFLGSIIPLPLVTSVTFWATGLVTAVSVASFLFFKKDTPLICTPKVISKFASRWSVIPDSVLQKSEWVQTLYCMAVFWSQLYIAVAAVVLIALVPVLVIFLSGWYFSWLVREVKIGNVRLWPWLVKSLHRATTPPRSAHKKVRVAA